MGTVKITPKRTSFQRFAVAEVSRAEIKNAPYNPRRISGEARSRLKAKIESVGLVNVLVWNKRTGNLVSGHQRLSILDELEGRGDYTLTVSVVEVDDRTEKELNVFLNNDASMGEWDSGSLMKLAEEFKDDIAGMGFAPGELDYLAVDSVEEKAEDGGEKEKRPTQAETQVIAVFRDAAETDAFLRLIGAPLGSRYVDAPKIFAKHGFNNDKAPTV